MRKILTTIGILLFLLGGCAMDSKSLLIPICMVIGGGLITLLTIEKGPQAYA
jgi:hypothetical protein